MSSAVCSKCGHVDECNECETKEMPDWLVRREATFRADLEQLRSQLSQRDEQLREARCAADVTNEVNRRFDAECSRLRADLERAVREGWKREDSNAGALNLLCGYCVEFRGGLITEATYTPHSPDCLVTRYLGGK